MNRLNFARNHFPPSNSTRPTSLCSRRKNRRYQAALRYLKGIALELDYYTGHKELKEADEPVTV